MNLDNNERGRYTVEISEETTFGQRLKHGLDGTIVLFGLRQHAGWKPFTAVHLPGQSYRKKVESWLEDHPNAREVAAVDVDEGEWVTVWETGWPHGKRADWMPKPTDK